LTGLPAYGLFRDLLAGEGLGYKVCSIIYNLAKHFWVNSKTYSESSFANLFKTTMYKSTANLPYAYYVKIRFS
jgi:hypothetical protein